MWRHSFSHGENLALKSYLEDLQSRINPRTVHKTLLFVITSATASYLVIRGFRYYRNRVIVKERGEAARLALQTLSEHLQNEEETGPVDEDKEAVIVGLSFTELQSKLRSGDLKALEVLRAYQRKALNVHKDLNCLTEPIFEAEAIAVELDLLRPNQRGPLHGIPVSIKDSFFIEGYDCHAGFALFANQPVDKSADIITLLKNLGAVPFVRTNFPQGLMSFACSNPVYGETVNPHNTKRGPGGSSGGEGALIGAGGSVFGIGSDIGGSIRIPCQMCGVYGFKPTVERILNKGQAPLSIGQTLVRCTSGFLARDMEGLVKVAEEVFTPKMHLIDPTVPPLYFRDELFEKKSPLRIGYYTSLQGAGNVHPACVRAVLQAKTVLETQYGYKLVAFQPLHAFEAVCDLFCKAVFGDDGEDGKFMKDEVLDQCVSFTYYIGRIPSTIRLIVAKLIEVLLDKQLGLIGQSTCKPPRKVVDWWRLQEKIQLYKTGFHDAWEKMKLDALICPGLPFPAVSLGCEDKVLSGISYTTLYNLLNYPAGMIPVTTVTDDDVSKLKNPSIYPCTGAMEKFVVKDCEGSVGLPVGVQVISQPFQEEIMLRVMKDIDKHTKT